MTSSMLNEKIDDPEKWEEFKPNQKEIDFIKKVFIKKIKNTFGNCVKGDRDYTIQPLYPEKIEIVGSYKSKLGSYVYGLEVPKNKYKCDGIVPDEYLPHWFYIAKKNVNFLGINIRPVEMSDFDKDGQSEWIFQYEGYNNDGYTLFHNSFKKKVEFNWHYH